MRREGAHPSADACAAPGALSVEHGWALPRIRPVVDLAGRILRTVRVRGVIGASGHYASRARDAARDLLSISQRAANRRWLRGLERCDRAFDGAYGVDTGGVIIPGRLVAGAPGAVSAESRHFAVSYIASDPEEYRRTMTGGGALKIDPREFVFIDFGSGKGRAVLLACQEPYRRVIGVEFSPMLHEVALRNIRAFRESGGIVRCGGVDLVCADAAEFALPQEPLACFLYNPFRGRILERVIGNIAASFARRPRPVYIFYSHPVEECQLERRPVFEKVAGGDLFAVYRCRQGHARGSRAAPL
ncbi:MAG: class I SAM-dependent methyltransferase [Phycisphaerales bacterium]